MAEIRVTASTLKQKSAMLKQLNTSLSTQINILQTNETSVCSMWEGEAKNAFQKAFIHDKQAMDEFKKAIDKYCQALDSIAQSYEKAENQNIQTAAARKYR